MAFTFGLTLYHGILSVACRKFGCAFSVDKFIEKLSVELFIDISSYCLYPGRALALPFGLTIYRFVPLPSPRIHARWIKERKNDRHKYDLDLAKSRANVHVEYPGDFSWWRPWQRIEFDFKNLIAVYLNQTRIKIVLFIRVDCENSIRHFDINNLYIGISDYVINSSSLVSKR